MNFRTTSTIEEQMNHVKKYAPLFPSLEVCTINV